MISMTLGSVLFVLSDFIYMLQLDTLNEKIALGGSTFGESQVLILDSVKHGIYVLEYS